MQKLVSSIRSQLFIFAFTSIVSMARLGGREECILARLGGRKDCFYGETVETVANFILGGSKITADGDCSHKIKKCLLLRRKIMTNLDSILKSRDITLPTKVGLVKAMVFPVVMYGCESWTIKKAEP